MAPPERHHKGILCGRALRGSSNAAPSTAHHRGTTNGSSDAAKGLQEELGIKQTAPPVLPGKHCSAGVAQSHLRSWREDTHPPAWWTPKTPPGRQTPRALPSTKQEMAPPERHHKGILCGRALRGSSNAAPSTAHQRGTTNGSSDAAKGLQEELGTNKLLLRCSLVNTALLGWHKATSKLARRHATPAWWTPKTPPGRQTPRALPSTKQEMAPPERHHKGILCGRALRGSSNAAPSTAHHRGTTNGSSDAAKGLQEQLGTNKLLLRCSLVNTALLGWHKATSKLAPRHDPPARWTPRMHPAGQKRQELCQAHSKKWLLQSGTTKGSSAAERSGAPQMLHHQRLTSRGTTNGSSDAAKGLQEELGIKQTAPPVLPGTTALLGRYKAILWSGASTRSSSVVTPGCLQDGKRQELCQAHSKKWLLQSGTTKGSSAAERSGAPQMLHHQRLTTVAPPTAPPMQQRGSKKSWAPTNSNKLLLPAWWTPKTLQDWQTPRAKHTAPPAGVGRALRGSSNATSGTSSSGAKGLQDTGHPPVLLGALLGWHTKDASGAVDRMHPGTKTPRALPSTQQEMAPPERHHKGILCGRALRGSSNAAPSTAHHRGTTNGSSDAAKGLQEELGIKQTAPPVLPGNHCSAGAAQSHLRSWRQDTLLQRGDTKDASSRTKNAKSFAKHKARNGSSRAAPQRDPLRPSAQGLLKCCTINGSPPWHHQRLLRCSKGAPRRAGHQTNCSSRAPS